MVTACHLHLEQTKAEESQERWKRGKAMTTIAQEESKERSDRIGNIEEGTPLSPVNAMTVSGAHWT